MNDSAGGQLAGYLFQFEKALLMLAELENQTDYISVEEIDDVSAHNADSTILTSLQAKHSISCSGNTFENTSNSLWRTLEIWVEKFTEGIYNDQTDFICCTNKIVPSDFLVRKIIVLSNEDTMNEFENLLLQQKEKLKEFKEKNPKSGSSISSIIKKMQYVINNKDIFLKIKPKMKIHDNENIKERFCTRIHVGSENYTTLQRDNIFKDFFGWISYGSKAKWKNELEARFTKKEFDEKMYQILRNPSIVNAIFRKKEILGTTILPDEILKKSKDLFVIQIEDITRNKRSKERIIQNAIIDFICCDIEIKHIIEIGNYTEEDFQAFLNTCSEVWLKLFDQKVIKEFTSYSEEEKNTLAVEIYDSIMNKVRIDFKEGFTFSPTNEYIRNGSFLKLSNIPNIGWHPDWQSKYKLL